MCGNPRKFFGYPTVAEERASRGAKHDERNERLGPLIYANPDGESASELLGSDPGRYDFVDLEEEFWDGSASPVD